MSNDIADIVNVINLYAVAVDTHSWDLLDEVFTEDVAVSFGGPAAFQGRAQLKQAFAAIHEPFESTQHITTNHQVKVAGDSATALAYVFGRFMRSVPEGGNLFESTGWYDDALVRTANGWRISRRSSRMTWWGGNPVVLQTAPGAGTPEVLASLCADARADALAHVRALKGK